MIALRVTEAAALSIVEQADYYRQSSGEPLAARWEAAVDEAVRSLLHMPERGTLCGFRSAALGGLRWIHVAGFPSHMIFYRYLQTERAVSVIQVLHGARDVESIFGDTENLQ